MTPDANCIRAAMKSFREGECKGLISSQFIKKILDYSMQSMPFNLGVIIKSDTKYVKYMKYITIIAHRVLEGRVHGVYSCKRETTTYFEFNKNKSMKYQNL